MQLVLHALVFWIVATIFCMTFSYIIITELACPEICLPYVARRLYVHVAFGLLEGAVITAVYFLASPAVFLGLLVAEKILQILEILWLNLLFKRSRIKAQNVKHQDG